MRCDLVDEPNDTLVSLVKFGIGMSACLSAVEIASSAFLHVWNGEIFIAISGLSGIVVDVFVGRKT